MMWNPKSSAFIIYLYVMCITTFSTIGLPNRYEDSERIEDNCTKQVDVAFAIDSSHSIGPYFNQILQLVKEFSRSVPVSEDDVRISVVQFSTKASVEFFLQDGTSLEETIKKIDAIQYKAGSTETGLALRTLREQVFAGKQGDRIGIPNVAILVTDGPASDHDLLIAESQRLRDSGTLAFAVGLGFLTDPQELRSVAGSNVLTTWDMEDVANLSRAIIGEMCQALKVDVFSTTTSPSVSNTSRRPQVPKQILLSTSSPTRNVAKTTVTSSPKDFNYENSTNVQTTSTSNVSHSSHSERGCKVTGPVDVVFAIDSSQNIGPINFKYVRLLVTSLLEKMDIDSGLQRTGVIQYSDDAVKVVPLDNVNSSQAILDAVLASQYKGGNANLAAALNSLELELLTRPRDGVTQMGIVIMGGQSTQTTLTKMHASILNHNGVDVFLVGVGNQVNEDEMSTLASQPSDEHVYTITNFTTPKDVLSGTVSSLCFGMLHSIKRTMGSTESKQEYNNNNNNNNTNGDGLQTSCKDFFQNCSVLTRQDCTDGQPWTKDNCALSCGYCFTNSSISIKSSVCRDAIPNCQDYGDYICHDPSYRDWTLDHCSKHCRLCDDGVSNETIRNSSNTPSQNSTSNQDSECLDLLPDCDNYGGPNVCQNFTDWASVRCRAYCGFCHRNNVTEPMEVHGVRCPQWRLPMECSLEKVEWSWCPMPSCPNGYLLTVTKG